MRGEGERERERKTTPPRAGKRARWAELEGDPGGIWDAQCAMRDLEGLEGGGGKSTCWR